jgi:hypothetical protein
MANVDGVDSQRGPRYPDGSLAIEAAADGMGIALRPLRGPT